MINDCSTRELTEELNTYDYELKDQFIANYSVSVFLIKTLCEDTFY